MLASELGEEALLQKLRDLFTSSPAENVVLGIGDDAAVMQAPPPGFESVLTTDLLLENIHFRPEWQTPYELGRKAMAVNLSDLAAMGAVPVYCLLSLAFPGDTEVDYLLEICQGAQEMAQQAGAPVIGGDTSASGTGLIISVTAGGIVPAGKALRRSGARSGDAIVVSGCLGSAAAGLKLLQRPDTDGFENLLQAFMAPQPELGLAQAAAAAGATSMTDLSDGLASDLRHICHESGRGAEISYDRIPVHPEFLAAAAHFGWDAGYIDYMIFSGGEDYGLLFTLPGGAAAQETVRRLEAETGRQLSVIGEIHKGGGIVLRRNGRKTGMPEHGFDHFLRRPS